MTRNNHQFLSLSSGLALLFFLLLVPTGTSGHGTGLSLVATSTLPGGETYQVDVDYSELGFYVGYSGRLTFNLLTDAAGSKAIGFTDLWVRITEGEDQRTGQTIFAAPIYKANYGGAGLLYTFTKPGKYLLEVRYNDSATTNPETLAEATFLINVEPYDEAKFPTNYLWLGIGFGSFILIIVIYFTDSPARGLARKLVRGKQMS